MKYPKITIVTPSFNQAEFLEQTINSVLNQEYPNLEYFVLDGGSTDGSVGIIEKYDDQIDWWVSEVDRGQTHAINKGFERATGELIAWLNSDDYYLPGCLIKVAKLYNERNFEFLAGALRLVDKKGEFIETKNPVWAPPREILFETQGFYMTQPACFWRRELLNKTGLLDESYHYAMDFDLWLRFRENGVDFELVNEEFTCFRQHEDAKSSDGEIFFIKEIFDHFARISKILNKEHRVMIRRMAMHIYTFDEYKYEFRVQFYRVLLNANVLFLRSRFRQLLILNYFRFVAFPRRIILTNLWRVDLLKSKLKLIYWRIKYPSHFRKK